MSNTPLFPEAFGPDIPRRGSRWRHKTDGCSYRVVAADRETVEFIDEHRTKFSVAKMALSTWDRVMEAE